MLSALICWNTEKGLGTAFLVRPNVLATAKHVIRKITSPVVEFLGGERATIERIQDVEGLDVSFVHLQRCSSGEGSTSLPLAASVGDLDPILVLGFPTVPFSLEPVLIPMKGETQAVTQLYRRGEQAEVLLLSCITRGGCSGAPVLNATGEVVGLVSEALFEKVAEGDHVAEGLGFSAAVPLAALRRCVVEYLDSPQHADQQRLLETPSSAGS